MALYLKVSNSLESLSGGLSEILYGSSHGVFDQHLIVTQTDGMNNWLKLQIAEKIGIAANCRFLKPNDLIHQIYFLLGGRFSEMLSGQNLTWLLFKLLGEQQFVQLFPDVADYYTQDTPDKELKRMSLAEKTADLFDQYQIYRPEMIKEWNEKGFTGEEWQQYLWVKIKQVSGNSLPDKTVVGQFILDELQRKEQRALLAARMGTVHLFGLSIITAYHVQLLEKLSRFIDVHFHIINPAPEIFWFEDRSEKQLARLRIKNTPVLENDVAGNALLMGWGRVVQDTFGLFFKHDAFINAYDTVDVLSPEPDNLLHKIQYDIFTNAGAERELITAEDLADGSVTVNSCYTVAREVEVLYNYLVHLVDKKREALSPRDIVVMVRDIDAYAPYIKAVFNNAPYQFRYTIADESYADSDNLFNALHAILQMNEEHFKAEDVLQLLDSSYIRRRFGITDVAVIRTAVDKANIRFGMQGVPEDETYVVSWKYGIRRIMFGICMSGEIEVGDRADSFFPLDLLEGSDSHELIRFCHFVEVLMQFVEDRKHARPITGWVAYMESLLHNLVYEPDEEVDEDYNTLMQQLSDYNLLNEYMPESVSFEVFSHSFLQTLTGNVRSGLFVNGGITFCSLIPMRSIPFKVVAMLGLDYDKFPRREHPIGFNLMEKSRQRGDRNVKENDKHLFLETILSARQYLYISYVGQHAKDNSRMPPSALVDELLDYIEAGMEEPVSVRKELVTQQPLQGFSRRYAGTDGRLYSYLNQVSPVVQSLVKTEKSTLPFSFEEINLEDLIRFFKHPFKTYYNKVLGVYYSDEQVLLQDTEIFALDSLQKWSLKNELLKMDTQAMPGLKTRLVKIGKLPLKNMGYVALQEVEKDVKPVRSLYQECTRDAEEVTMPFQLMIDGSQLSGTLKGIFNDRLVQVSWSKKENKYLLEAYIRYLAGVAAGILKGAYFISGAAKKQIYAAVPITREDATARLTTLVQLYKSGFEKILPFSPDFEMQPSAVEALDFEQFTKIVDARLNNYNVSFADRYMMQEYEKGIFAMEVTMEAYKAVCRQLITPLAALLPGYFD